MLGKTTYLCNFVKIKGKSIFPPCAERKLIATLLRASRIGAEILQRSEDLYRIACPDAQIEKNYG